MGDPETAPPAEGEDAPPPTMTAKLERSGTYKLDANTCKCVTAAAAPAGAQTYSNPPTCRPIQTWTEGIGPGPGNRQATEARHAAFAPVTAYTALPGAPPGAQGATGQSYAPPAGPPPLGLDTLEFCRAALVLIISSDLAGMKNANADCWSHCGSLSGSCGFCGTGKCCRAGWKGGEHECLVGEGGAAHTCVAGAVCNGTEVVVPAGSSKFNDKEFIVPGASWCSALPVNPQGAGWQDTFSAFLSHPDTLHVQRVDTTAGWGQDLRIKCCVPPTKDQAIKCQDTVVTVGTSKFQETELVVPGVSACASTAANPQNPNWPDKFSVDVHGDTVHVKRTDAPAGWGQNLQFHCCLALLKLEPGKLNLPGSVQKNIEVQGVNSCSSTPANPQNPGWKDRFEVDTSVPGTVGVRRMDANAAWGQDLKLHCSIGKDSLGAKKDYSGLLHPGETDALHAAVLLCILSGLLVGLRSF
eukprot:gene5585-1000_t